MGAATCARRSADRHRLHGSVIRLERRLFPREIQEPHSRHPRALPRNAGPHMGPHGLRPRRARHARGAAGAAAQPPQHPRPIPHHLLRTIGPLHLLQGRGGRQPVLAPHARGRAMERRGARCAARLLPRAVPRARRGSLRPALLQRRRHHVRPQLQRGAQRLHLQGHPAGLRQRHLPPPPRPGDGNAVRAHCLRAGLPVPPLLPRPQRPRLPHPRRPHRRRLPHFRPRHQVPAGPRTGLGRHPGRAVPPRSGGRPRRGRARGRACVPFRLGLREPGQLLRRLGRRRALRQHQRVCDGAGRAGPARDGAAGDMPIRPGEGGRGAAAGGAPALLLLGRRLGRRLPRQLLHGGGPAVALHRPLDGPLLPRLPRHGRPGRHPGRGGAAGGGVLRGAGDVHLQAAGHGGAQRGPRARAAAHQPPAPQHLPPRARPPRRGGGEAHRAAVRVGEHHLQRHRRLHHLLLPRRAQRRGHDAQHHV
mmetsp:Transcript_52007/g.108622  ORF Transcript_52007/g.108622 Transcript_52007/m.108622 type:complete len:476 (+) Transcript_52007:431-1858(+)